MKITEYPKINELLPDDEMVINRGGVGTKSTTIGDLFTSIQGFDVEEDLSDEQILFRHLNTFRGKNLGASFTDKQKEAIRTKTFDDLYVGDYWEIGGIKWRIVDINYFYDPDALTSVSTAVNHLVIMPDEPIINAKYANQNTTELDTRKTYLQTDLAKTYMSQAISKINAAFGANHLLEHKETFYTAYDTNSTVVSSVTAACPSIEMVVGYLGWEIIAQSKYNINIFGRPQFALFRIMPKFKKSNSVYWFRNNSPLDPYNSMTCMYSNSTIGERLTVNPKWAELGVRPEFAIQG